MVASRSVAEIWDCILSLSLFKSGTFLESTSICKSTNKFKYIRVVDGKWAIILDYIEGKTLQSLMDEHPEKEDE